ncbi:DUF1249 domain-containing protein [Candidatus Sororendozoicomonas aggregata]|uniref:DUF1249 domain-containing protein n=1 Tax=Candidatus Sororendozoicomonas aggregata TaxID=3073239 RepID=UPI002ED32C77
MTTLAKKTICKVDLSRQHSLCEVNYARLMKLLPCLQHQDQVQFLVHHSSDNSLSASRFDIWVLNRAPYTTSIHLKMSAAWGRWLTLPELKVQLYHDVQMAEVTGAQKYARLPLITHYPNGYMLSLNEKAQLNQFLSELLDFCISGGHVPDAYETS